MFNKKTKTIENIKEDFVKEIPSLRKQMQDALKAEKQAKKDARKAPVKTMLEQASVEEATNKPIKAFSVAKIKGQYYVLTLTIEDNKVTAVEMSEGDTKAIALEEFKVNAGKEFWIKEIE